MNVGSLSFLWSTGSNQRDIHQLQAGTYTVTVSAGNGCTASESYTITQPDSAISMIAFVQGERCIGSADGSIVLAVTGGISPYQFNWPDGSHLSARNNLSPGIHEVELTDAAGCVHLKKIHVPGPETEISALPQISPVTCFGADDGSIQLDAIGGTPPYSIRWNTGRKSNTLSLLSAGIYTASISDANGCTTSLQFNVTQPLEPLTANFTSEAFDCAHSIPGKIIASVSGGTSPYRFSWSNGDSTAHI
ncbi:MAG: SprB repeat-containing protein, partial [Bacteroidota bacterium]